MSQYQTELLAPDAAGIAQAAGLLADGHIIAMPTETVYGLAGDATNDVACARIFDAKGRPRFNPLIIHLPSLDAARQIAVLTKEAEALAKAFWPGPLTLVLPLRPGHGLSQLVTAGLNTVAIRIPAHPIARALLSALPFPLAAPSANPSGRISPTSPSHVMAGLKGKLAGILDGGTCDVGLESTILAAGPPPRLLREGGLARETIEPITGPLLTDTTPGKVQAPGQLSSHYAPVAQLHMDSNLLDDRAIRIGYGPGMASDLTLSTSGDLVEAAANLFSILHRADALANERGATEIHVAEVPNRGLGRAINDRLNRAAAPRAD